VSSRLYHSQKWRRRAKQQLEQEPLCRPCRAVGKITAAKVADHVIPCGDDPAAFWEGELQSVCDPCHQAKRQAERHGKTWQPRLGCASDGTPIDPAHHWNVE
jgi:5-methylcytosine-specific restriction enzyme A